MAASSDGRCSAASTLIAAASSVQRPHRGMRRHRVAASAAATRPSPASPQRSIRRRSSRSASTPPYRPNTTSGTSSATPSRPTANADPVSCLACTSSATSVAWVPNSVTLRLAYSTRKLPRSGRAAGKRPSAAGCGSSSVSPRSAAPHANTRLHPRSPHFPRTARPARRAPFAAPPRPPAAPRRIRRTLATRGPSGLPGTPRYHMQFGHAHRCAWPKHSRAGMDRTGRVRGGQQSRRRGMVRPPPVRGSAGWLVRGSRVAGVQALLRDLAKQGNELAALRAGQAGADRGLVLGRDGPDPGQHGPARIGQVQRV